MADKPPSVVSLNPAYVVDRAVQLLRSGQPIGADTRQALTLLLSMLGNCIWHEEVNHQQTLSPALRDAAEAVAAAIVREA